MAAVPVGNRRRALLSVTDKDRLAEIGKLLHGYDFELVASGGTASHLRDSGLPVIEVSEMTGFPEIFGGRVKTLHPAILGGILGPTEESFAETVELGIGPIDLVVVNLYQFQEAVAAGAGETETVEKIDIGGPSLLRAAAKNFSRVTVISEVRFYDELIAELERGKGSTSLDFRHRMAGETFRLAADYNEAIAFWFAGTDDIPLRYGENPHQEATLKLPAPPAGEPKLAGIGLTQHGGKELSYNNIVDLVAAVKLVGDFDQPCCGILKHTNPCGFGLGDGVTGLDRALKCDPVSAFGGVFAFNSCVDEEAAEVLAKRFLEIIVAPEFTAGALARLTKKKNVRVLTVDPERFLAGTKNRSRTWGELVLTQSEDEGFPELDEWDVVAGDEPDSTIRTALEMVWKVCKHGKSNAIVLGDMTATLGMGFGQMSRVDSTELAVMKAGNQDLDLTGCVAASDGFFPFPDGIEKLAAAGARAVIAPGGSIRDDEVAEAARKLGITLVLTGRRHFNH